MNKAIRLIQNYLIIGLPFVIICMAWSTISPNATSVLWEILSWNLMLWFVMLITYLFMIVAVPAVRETTLKRLANLKERDEREEYITGRASRAAYISTLALLILFLFLSIFTVNIYRVPESEAVDGKTGTISIGFQFNLLDQATKKENPAGEMIFESRDIPLSKSAIILILIAWQLASFNLTARRENLLN